jgi:hypothetical protein
MNRTRWALKIAGVSIATLVAVFIVLGVTREGRSVISALAQTFSGPGACAAGQCQGALGVNGTNNIGVGGAAVGSTRLFVYTTTSAYSAITASGTVYSTAGGFKFPDNTIQTTAYLAGSGLASTSAPNVSAGQFGANTSGGNFTFPASLGVGTTTASAALDVVSASSWAQFTRGGKLLYVNANYSGGNSYGFVGMRNADNMGLSLSSSDTHPEYLFVGTSGNVGIGTTAPGATLDVRGTVSTTQVRFADGTTQTTAAVAGGGTVSTSTAVSTGNFPYWGTATKLTGTSSIVQSAGNIGIGTSTPARKLDVNGDIRVNQQIYSPAAYTGFLTDAGAAQSVKVGTLTVSASYANTAETNGIYADNSINTGGMGRFKGWYTAGTGLALETGISSGQGYVMAYDRTGATYSTLNLQAGSNLLTLNNNGTANFAHDITQSTGVYVYPGSHAGLTNGQTSYYIASDSNWGLYTGTSMYFAGGVYVAYSGGSGFGLLGNGYTTYGGLANINTKGGYYGMLFGTGTTNANYMFDSSGNGGLYYESRAGGAAAWAWYYVPSAASMNINYGGNLGYTLGVSGTGYYSGALDVGGTLTVGSGTGKINVGTVDPLYTIDGKRYATYLAGMTGQKEETTGAIQCATKAAGCSVTIDFTNLAKGSDLWLFSRATNLPNNFEKLTVLLTPSFDGKVWYEKDAAVKKLTIHGDGSGEVSYRLTAPRFDAGAWTNDSDAKDEGFNLDKLLKK